MIPGSAAGRPRATGDDVPDGAANAGVRIAGGLMALKGG